jgi:hypothetical protein
MVGDSLAYRALSVAAGWGVGPHHDLLWRGFGSAILRKTRHRRGTIGVCDPRSGTDHSNAVCDHNRAGVFACCRSVKRILCIVYAWRFSHAHIDYATLPDYSYRLHGPTVISPLPRVQSDEDDGYRITRSGTPNTSSVVGERVNSSPILPRSSRNG